MLDLVSAGMLLVFVGFAFMVLASVLSSGRDGRTVSGGAVVMIGPLPIVFGSNAKWASVAIALAIVLFLLGMLSYLV